MNRRKFMMCVMAAGAKLTLSGACNAAVKSVAKQQKPNILILLIDDQGYADLSAFQHAAHDISTPNMARIAKQGVLCTQAYVSAPVCSPSRAGWNTGRYQERWDKAASWAPGLPINVKTIAEYFKQAGYITGKVGKSDFGRGYHNPRAHEYPLNHGYDEFLGFCSHAHDYDLLSEEIEKRTPDPRGASATLGPLFDDKTRKSYENGYTTDIFTNKAIDFIKRHKNERFFLTLAYNSVHHLIHEVPKRYLKKYGVKPIPDYNPATMGRYRHYYRKYSQIGAISDADMRKYYLANLNCLDDNVGRVMDALKKLNLDDNTLVILFTDNGGSPLTGANNRPLRGSKYKLFEGGIRVPFAIRWPGHLPAGKVYNYRISSLDILPTTLAAAGITPPADAQLDGYNEIQAIKNNQPSAWVKMNVPMFWKFQNNWAVRYGDWKLVKTTDFTSRKPTSQILQGPAAPNRPMLFNLTTDPAEQHDLYETNPDMVKKLYGMYQKWCQQLRNGWSDFRRQ